MGAETFNMALQPKDSIESFALIERYILEYSPHISPDDYYLFDVDAPAFVYRDHESLFEIKLYSNFQGVSVRYAVCGPHSVDSRACDFVFDVAKKFRLMLIVDWDNSHEVFDFTESSPNFDVVSESILNAAQRVRKQWLDMCNVSSDRPLRPDEAFSLLIDACREKADTDSE